MTWRYHQKTGKLEHADSDGDLVYIATGYSGAGEGKNNPALEHMANLGPIPRGRYQISAPRTSERTGLYVFDLIPDGHDAYKRTDFQIHCNHKESPGSASTGCIVLGRAIREMISESDDNQLEVV